MTRPALTTTYTAAEWRTLLRLRIRYEQGCDRFSDHEQSHLRFMRWLYRTGRLER